MKRTRFFIFYRSKIEKRSCIITLPASAGTNINNPHKHQIKRESFLSFSSSTAYKMMFAFIIYAEREKREHENVCT